MRSLLPSIPFLPPPRRPRSSLKSSSVPTATKSVGTGLYELTASELSKMISHPLCTVRWLSSNPRAPPEADQVVRVLSGCGGGVSAHTFIKGLRSLAKQWIHAKLQIYL